METPQEFITVNKIQLEINVKEIYSSCIEEKCNQNSNNSIDLIILFSYLLISCMGLWVCWNRVYKEHFDLINLIESNQIHLLNIHWRKIYSLSWKKILWRNILSLAKLYLNWIFNILSSAKSLTQLILNHSFYPLLPYITIQFCDKQQHCYKRYKNRKKIISAETNWLLKPFTSQMNFSVANVRSVSLEIGLKSVQWQIVTLIQA